MKCKPSPYDSKCCFFACTILNIVVENKQTFEMGKPSKSLSRAWAVQKSWAILLLDLSSGILRIRDNEFQLEPPFVKESHLILLWKKEKKKKATKQQPKCHSRYYLLTVDIYSYPHLCFLQGSGRQPGFWVRFKFCQWNTLSCYLEGRGEVETVFPQLWQQTRMCQQKQVATTGLCTPLPGHQCLEQRWQELRFSDL